MSETRRQIESVLAVHGITSACVAEDLVQIVGDIEQAERERCMRAVCPRCAGGWPLNSQGWHVAPEAGHILLPAGECQAWALKGGRR